MFHLETPVDPDTNGVTYKSLSCPDLNMLACIVGTRTIGQHYPVFTKRVHKLFLSTLSNSEGNPTAASLHDIVDELYGLYDGYRRSIVGKDSLQGLGIVSVCTTTDPEHSKPAVFAEIRATGAVAARYVGTLPEGFNADDMHIVPEADSASPSFHQTFWVPEKQESAPYFAIGPSKLLTSGSASEKVGRIVILSA